MSKENQTRAEYEKELHKLIVCDEDPLLPVTAFGRDLKRTVHAMRGFNISEYGMVSDDILVALTIETYYCAVERVALITIGKARYSLEYQGDSDGLVQEMLQRLRERLDEQQLFRKWRRKRQYGKILDYAVREVMRRSLFLYFGAEMRIRNMNNTPSLFGKLTYKGSLVRLTEALFPSRGYMAVGIYDAGSFVEQFLSFVQWLNMAYNSSNGNNTIFTINIINPQPDTITRHKLWFLTLSDSGDELGRMLRMCIASNPELYVRLAVTEFSIEQECQEKEKEEKRKALMDEYYLRLREEIRQLRNTNKDTELLFDEAINEIKKKEGELAELRSRTEVQFSEIKRLLGLNAEQDNTIKHQEQEIAALRQCVDTSDDTHCYGTSQHTYGRITQCLLEQERINADNMARWLETEERLIAIFNDIPEITSFIRNRRLERSEEQRNQKAKSGDRTIHITNNHGPIVTGDAVKRIEGRDGTRFDNPETYRLENGTE